MEPGPSQGQHIARYLIDALLKQPRDALALDGVFDLVVQRVHVGRQPRLLPQVVEDVLVRGQGVFRHDAELLGEGADEGPGILGTVAVALGLVPEQGWVLPDGLAVLAPEAGQGPAR